MFLLLTPCFQVNPSLYKLQKKSLVIKCHESPPTWSLKTDSDVIMNVHNIRISPPYPGTHDTYATQHNPFGGDNDKNPLEESNTASADRNGESSSAILAQESSSLTVKQEPVDSELDGDSKVTQSAISGTVASNIVKQELQDTTECESATAIGLSNDTPTNEDSTAANKDTTIDQDGANKGSESDDNNVQKESQDATTTSDQQLKDGAEAMDTTEDLSSNMPQGEL